MRVMRNDTRRALRIGIVGYGTGGQAAAVCLSRDGHRVEVFEQAPAPRPIGAGFLLQPTGMMALWELGLLDDACGTGVGSSGSTDTHEAGAR
jgi:FAD-dependent urate hydroxylase